jgi:hypothetical protein
MLDTPARWVWGENVFGLATNIVTDTEFALFEMSSSPPKSLGQLSTG